MSARTKISISFHSRRGARHERPTQDQPQQQQQQQQQQQTDPPTTPPAEEDQDEQRRARDWLRSTISSQDRFAPHMATEMIRIDCPHTLTELQALGRLPKDAGTAACGKLVRAPVIHDEIASFVWAQLAAQQPSFPDDGRFRFDGPAPRGRRRESPPVSPKARRLPSSRSVTPPRRRSPNRPPCHFCADSIPELDEVLEEVQGGALEVARGRLVSPSGRKLSSQTLGAPALVGNSHPLEFFSAERKDSYDQDWLFGHRDGKTSSNSSRASSVDRLRSGVFAGRLGSVVGGIGKSFGTSLARRLSHGDGGQPNKSRPTASL